MELRRPRRVLVDCLIGCWGGDGDRLRVDREAGLVSFDTDFRFEDFSCREGGFEPVDFLEEGFGAPLGVGIVARPLAEAYLFLEGGLFWRAPRVVRLLDGG